MWRKSFEGGGSERRRNFVEGKGALVTSIFVVVQNFGQDQMNTGLLG